MGRIGRDFRPFLAPGAMKSSGTIVDLTDGENDKQEVQKPPPYVRYPPDAGDKDALFELDKESVNRCNNSEWMDTNLAEAVIHILLNDPQVLSADMRSNVHAFSPHFFTRLKEEPSPEAAFQSVKRWGPGKTLFSKDFVFFPVVERSHWSLLVLVRPFIILGSVSKDAGLSCILAMDSYYENDTNRSSFNEAADKLDNLPVVTCQQVLQQYLSVTQEDIGTNLREKLSGKIPKEDVAKFRSDLFHKLERMHDEWQVFLAAANTVTEELPAAAAAADVEQAVVPAAAAAGVDAPGISGVVVAIPMRSGLAGVDTGASLMQFQIGIHPPTSAQIPTLGLSCAWFKLIRYAERLGCYTEDE
eukprot:gene11643-13058_t